MFCLDLKDILASRVRQKILMALAKAKSKELHMMALVHKLNSPYNEVNRNVGILEREAIVINYYPTLVKRGKARIVVLNDNPKTKVLLQAMAILNAEN